MQKIIFHVSLDPTFKTYDSIRAYTVEKAFNAYAKKVFLQYAEPEATLTIFAQHVDERSFDSRASRAFTIARGEVKCQVFAHTVKTDFITPDDADATATSPRGVPPKKRKMAK